MKDIYSLNLHESMEVEVDYINYHVTRVASGWIYSYIRLDSGVMTSVFVPYIK